MKRSISLGIVLALVVAAYWAGYHRRGESSGSHDTQDARKVLYYVDPMNPSHTSDKPGFAPCGMKMEPVYASTSEGAPGTKAETSSLPGTVRLSLERQQLIGVKVSATEQKKLIHNLRLLGKVGVDETRIYRINATIDGWITKTLPLAAGSEVKKDETLAAFYSPEFLAASQALIYGLNASDRVKPTGQETEVQRNQLATFDFSIKQYRDSLRNLGMGELQIQELIRTRKYTENVNITSPADGYVQLRNVSDGQRFEKGTELFRIADLTRVWVIADVFEREARFLKPGLKARVIQALQGKVFEATLSTALPQFDPGTRTLKLRLEAENPGLDLKPDMFVDVEFPVDLPETVVVPAEAIVEAGIRKAVYVDRGNGVFEPRLVETGARINEEVQVLDGLTVGERIVTSGTFLLDSESRMKLAAAGLHGLPANDPVCGMKVEEAKARAAGRVAEKEGKTYFFCSDTCKEQFLHAAHETMKESIPAMAGGNSAAGQTAIDPVCGMRVDQAKARAANRFSEFEGKTHYFCNETCKTEFLAKPKEFPTSK